MSTDVNLNEQTVDTSQEGLFVRFLFEIDKNKRVKQRTQKEKEKKMIERKRKKFLFSALFFIHK